MMRSSSIGPTLCLALACALAACGGSQSALIYPNSPPGNGDDTSHYAGTYYPIYGIDGKAPQWIKPDSSMPFDKVSDIFVAFGHAYEDRNGAIFTFERGKCCRDEPIRLKHLEDVAREKNPHVKVLITLGWGANTHDWDAIRKDHANKAGLFVPSVIAFLRENNLDGFDIDDESVGYESGKISQTAFNAVIAQLRRALDAASKKDGHAYAFVITPAGNNATKGGIADTNIDKTNAHDFDWVNIQSYYGASDEPPFSQKLIDGLKEINYPDKSIAFGVETDETKCNPTFPSPKELEGLKGMFNWNMTADSTCDPAFKYTLQVAKDVGY